MSKKLRYVTNLDPVVKSGGWSGMNHNIHRILTKHFDVHKLSVINPSQIFVEKWTSRLKRKIGLKGRFPGFSKRRLRAISQTLDLKNDETSEILFFHGSTSWVDVQTDLPYYCYVDACFQTYLDIYHSHDRFMSDDIQRIINAEKRFLQNAKTVFFSSEWAKSQTTQLYNIDDKNFELAYVGTDLPTVANAYDKSNPFILFVGLNFEKKGGHIVAQALQIARKTNPKLTLMIVGERPPQHIIDIDGVEYLGLLNKSNQKDLTKLISLYRNALCMVLPTSKDMTPVVIIEALSQGCPVISSNNFGIPELLDHSNAGILIEPNDLFPDSLSKYIVKLIDDDAFRTKISERGYQQVKQKYNWESIAGIIEQSINQTVT